MKNLVVSAALVFTSLTTFAVNPSAAESFTVPLKTGASNWSIHTISSNDLAHVTGAQRELNYVAIQTDPNLKLSENDLFTDRSDLIVGIDVTGNTQGHTYLIIDGIRFDGRMFFAPSTVMNNNWHLSRGLFIRYKNVPESSKAALREFLRSGKVVKKATCVSAAMAVLFEKGHFVGPGRRYLYPHQLLTYLARHGLVTEDHVRVQPEIYTLNSDIRLFWNNLPTWKEASGFLFKVLLDPYTWKGFSGGN